MAWSALGHLADIESIHTYEGTESIQSLLIGRDLTGVSAFHWVRPAFAASFMLIEQLDTLGITVAHHYGLTEGDPLTLTR